VTGITMAHRLCFEDHLRAPPKVKTVSAAGDLRGCEAVGGIERVEEA